MGKNRNTMYPGEKKNRASKTALLNLSFSRAVRLPFAIILLCDRVETNSINPVSQGKVTGQNPCIHAGLRRFDGHSHSIIKMFLDCTARHSSAPVHRKLPGNAKQKSSRPYGQTPCKDGSLKLPWYHLGLPHPRRYGLEAAAAGAELGSRGVQPDALTGVPVAGLALLHFAHAAPRPFSVPCFLPFSTVRALW